MKIRKENRSSDSVINVLREISIQAEKDGISNMSLEEINAEISKVRNQENDSVGGLDI